jgi:hypothetical protein
VPRTAIVAVLVGAVVALVAAPGFVKLDEPTSDGLFYEVEKLRLQGHGAAEATRMVFDAPIARETARIEDEPDEPRVLDPAWVEYSERFYRRRWLVPALAAAVEPLVGDQPGRALRVASLIGYVLIAPVLFLLLRRRFSTSLSAGLAVACTLAPPVYKWSLGMRVDSWGLLLETLGLLAAVLVADRGRRWLALWVVAIAALSITRDATALYAGLALAAAALVALVARPSGGDPYFSLMKASLPGCVLLLLLANNPQAYRLELVFVPMAAVGLAILAMRLVAARYPRVTA